MKDDSFDCTLIAHLRIFLLFYRLLYCLILPENRLFFGIWKVVEIVLCDRKISKRPGYAGWAVATTAGNAVAVPAVVGLADKSLEAYVPQATAQVAASVVITAIIVPIVTNWWAHKYGCPKFPLEDKKAATK